MALSIGVKAGARLTIGDKNMSVVKVVTPALIKILVDGKEFEITDLESTQVLPDVRISAGLWSGKGSQLYTRLAFEAPYHIRIERVREDRAA